MKGQAILTTLILCCFSAIYAQQWDHYKPLKSAGEVPDDITEAYTNKYEREREQISENARRRTRKRQDEFYRRSEYFLNEFLVSGDVLFGDTVTEYVSEILDLLLQDYPDLRNELRVYTVKSPVVNAFATESGILFVNLGLIAEVENEAQLAYILAHEVIHYEKNHVINQYIEQEKISNGEDLYRRTGRDEKLNAMSTYSKSQELEADEIGFEKYFSHTSYNQLAAIHVMDVLQYSYLPFDEIKFDEAYLEKGNFTIPDDFLLEEISPITAEADYDDSESTHPNIDTRKSALERILETTEGDDYIVSEEMFRHAQRLARYELTRLYLHRRQYPQAIYNTYLLKQKYGEDRYQRLSIAKALNAASVYRNESELDDISAEYEDIEGESQQVYHILSKFDKEDLNTLSVAYAYDLLNDYPDDEAAQRLFHRSMYDLVLENELRAEDFEKERAEDAFNLDSLVESSSNRSSKIANITRKRQVEEEGENYYRYAFVDYWEDSLFTARFSELEELLEQKENKAPVFDYGGDDNDDKYAKNKALGVDKVLCVTPMYLKLDEREEDGIKYLNSDEGLEDYRQQIMDVSQIVGLDLEMMDFKYLREDDVELYNEISLLKNWIAERIAHENTDVILSDFDNLKELGEKYGTDYIAYTGNLSLRVREDNVFTQVMFSIIIYPLLPFTIADLIIPDYESFNFFFLFDIRNGDALLTEYNYFETGDRTDYVRSILYNHLLQVKDKPKKS